MAAAAGYTGAQAHVEREGLQWKIAMKRGKLNAMPQGCRKAGVGKRNRSEANIRARVERPLSREQAEARLDESSLFAAWRRTRATSSR